MLAIRCVLRMKTTSTWPHAELSDSHWANDHILAIDDVLGILVVQRRNKTVPKIMPHPVDRLRLQHS